MKIEYDECGQPKRAENVDRLGSLVARASSLARELRGEARLRWVRPVGRAASDGEGWECHAASNDVVKESYSLNPAEAAATQRNSLHEKKIR
ncbi:hypothetical protein C2845_PM11G04560 [Panicum miliaceum]|uniref:Uncharacterized protein n=1 Tax=Panicum miliaceum TaxID=4540 RepID=A0A3L6RRQ1_PANMI|nr:hypothetical protein C2845_PM11G04560 [Panicum miliaceum]